MNESIETASKHIVNNLHLDDIADTVDLGWLTGHPEWLVGLAIALTAMSLATLFTLMHMVISKAKRRRASMNATIDNFIESGYVHSDTVTSDELLAKAAKKDGSTDAAPIQADDTIEMIKCVAGQTNAWAAASEPRAAQNKGTDYPKRTEICSDELEDFAMRYAASIADESGVSNHEKGTAI